jgi:mycoredoxin
MVDAEPSATAAEAVTVYWRPGCYFCNRLMRVFTKAGVVFEMRNIWEDDEARALVRAHNGGDETVPTVALGDDVRTNPDPRSYVEHLRRSHPDLVTETPPAPGLRSRLLGQ